MVKAAMGSFCFSPHGLWAKYHKCSPNNTLPSIKNTLDSWNVVSAILHYIFLRKLVYVSNVGNAQTVYCATSLEKKASGICQQFTQSFYYCAICLMCAHLFSLVHHMEFCYFLFLNL